MLFARFVNVLFLTNNTNRNKMRGAVRVVKKLSALAKFIILYGLLLLYDFPLHAMIYN